MSTVAIVFATKHGHTRSIAEQAAKRCEARHRVILAEGFAEGRAAIARADAALLISPIHAERHDSGLLRLAKTERDRLAQIPSAFITTSLTQATAQDASRSPADRAAATSALDRVVERFVTETGWRPRNVLRMAGRLAYTRYGFFTRFIMKRIAKKSGGSTDTSRDHEYTDWTAFERFLDGWLDSLGVETTARTPPMAEAPL